MGACHENATERIKLPSAFGQRAPIRARPAARHDAPSKDKPRAPSSRDLAQSGGVVEPPPTPDASVISPPRDTDSRMPTAPKVASDSKKQGSGSPNGLSAADLSMLQSILVAARDQARRGREDDCRESLRKARRLLRDSK